jgi:lipid-binding SYLF domain-containing protein
MENLMRRETKTFGLVAALLLAACQVAVAQDGAGKAESKRIEERQRADSNAELTLQELFAENEGAKALYGKAAGYAVFAATKAGFVVSGGGGTGVAVDKTSGKHTYMKMGTGGVGLSFGARRFDLVILFETEARLNTFIDGGWDSTAAANATAGHDSAGVASTFFDGIAFYQLSNKGLMASADVSGTRFWVDEDLN